MGSDVTGSMPYSTYTTAEIHYIRAIKYKMQGREDVYS